jgi:DNA invertase Pin-like site-specific DNA recombinase
MARVLRDIWVDFAQMRRLTAGGLGPTEIGRQLGVSRRQVYRIMEEREALKTPARISPHHARKNVQPARVLSREPA